MQERQPRTPVKNNITLNREAEGGVPYRLILLTN